VPLELIKLNSNAFLLAYIIAHRAHWRGEFNQHGLANGEAFLGDYATCGMTERGYRTAKQQLEKFKFATFRATNKGTIGKLIDSRLFFFLDNQGDGQNDTQATDSRRTSDGQATDSRRLTNNLRSEDLKNGTTQHGGAGGVESCESLPKGFPETEAEAKAHNMGIGCPEDFAVHTWRKVMSRGGKDAKGLMISSFPHYLATEWKYEQERRAKTKAAGGKAPSIWEMKQSLEEIEQRIEQIVSHGAGGAVDVEPKNREEYNRLRRERSALKEGIRKAGSMQAASGIKPNRRNFGMSDTSGNSDQIVEHLARKAAAKAAQENSNGNRN
jgi:hypothetical protein